MNVTVASWPMETFGFEGRSDVLIQSSETRSMSVAARVLRVFVIRVFADARVYVICGLLMLISYGGKPSTGEWVSREGSGQRGRCRTGGR